MDKQIIFEDEHIRVIYLKAHTSTLVISFGDLITRAKGTMINAEKSLFKYGYAALGIMPKQKSWYPAASMQAMLPHVLDILQQYSYRVGYGGSMGAYAAIKYAKALQMQRVIAMVPQYSIDPTEVVDSRYHGFYDPELNHNMRIQAEDIDADCEYIILYDPYYAEDREHYLKIKPLIPQLKHLHVPHTGHDVIAVLANSALLHDFIEHTWDEHYFYRQIRQVKKSNKFYYRGVIARLLGQHYHALGDILKNLDMQLDAQFFDNQLKQRITRILLAHKQVDQQDLEKLGINIDLPQQQKNQLYDAQGQVLVFNLISQKIESYPQQVVDLNGKYIIPLIIKATGLAQVDIQGESYYVAMNDRRIFKLLKTDAVLTTGLHPIIVKKYSDYYVLSYKQFNLACNTQGYCQFESEDIVEDAKFYHEPFSAELI
ncbi:hypothetical protein [Acinetobacter larvae]|uniref:Alpha/beta hydrolase n=1 Tax=Acinetobacter larvae TaxID=1789224 RepID=A0A1B2M2D3_9GAMM|nr:hypothetical protein [Acinetobacter larvae]AOA59348.1 hypothetical protein BFG52_13940 [Acinetobacter larvae]